MKQGSGVQGLIPPAVLAYLNQQKGQHVHSPHSQHISPHVPLHHVSGVPSEGFPHLTKSSLLFLGLGLMFLGACFFSAGFLFSIWFEKKDHASLEIKKTVRSLPVGRGTLSKNIKKVASTVSSEVKKEVLPSHERVAPVAAPTGERYAVQLGAFVVEDNARDLIDKLDARQIASVLVVQKGKSDSPPFCVRTTNQFGTYEAAEVAAEALSTQENLSAIVVPLVQKKPMTSGEQ